MSNADNTVWVAVYPFGRFVDGKLIYDHEAEYEYYLDEYGFVSTPTGRSRVVPLQGKKVWHNNS